MLNALSSLPPALRQTLIYGLSLAAVKGVSLLMVPFATHYLVPADYGRLDVLQTLADLLSIIIGMGMADTLFRFAGESDDPERQRQISANLLGLTLVIAVAALLVTQLAAPWISRQLPGGITELQTRLILGSLTLGGISTLCLSRLRMQERAAEYALGSVGRVVLQALASGTLLVLGFGVTGFMLGGFCAATLLAAWLLYRHYRETGIRFEAQQVKAYVRYGGPLIFVGFSGFLLGSFDRWLLADAIGAEAMAEYALAAKFGLITAIAIQPFDLWWLPRRFHQLNQPNGRENCAYLGGLGVTLGILAALLVVAGGPLLIEWLTPASYHGAARYLPWLAFLAVLHHANTTLGMGCFNRADTTWPALIDAGAALVAVAGYLLLIPRWGNFGAIVATSVALSVRLFATVLISQRLTPLPYPLRRLASFALIALASTGWLQTLPTAIEIAIAGHAALLFGVAAAVLLGLIRLPSPSKRWLVKVAG